MKISIGTGSQAFDLCAGNAKGEYSEAFALNGAEVVQEAQFLRAVTSKAFPRGNTRTTASFTITKEHADARTCEAYILDHHAAIPKTGDVLFIAEGSGSTTRKLSDAAFVSHSARQIGVTSIHVYQFTGGDFS